MKTHDLIVPHWQQDSFREELCQLTWLPIHAPLEPDEAKTESDTSASFHLYVDVCVCLCGSGPYCFHIHVNSKHYILYIRSGGEVGLFSYMCGFYNLCICYLYYWPYHITFVFMPYSLLLMLTPSCHHSQ